MKITWLLVRREFVERVRQRSFVVGTAIGMAGIIALAFIPQLLSSYAKSTASRIGVIAPDAAVAAATAKSLAHTGDRINVLSMRSRGPALPAALRSDLNADRYDAALVGYRDEHGHLAFAYYPKASSSLQESETLQSALQQAVMLTDMKGSARAAAERAMHFSFDVHSLNRRYRNEADQIFSTGIVYFLLVILYIAVIAYGMMVAQGVIEEKANRIMEVMIGAVRPSQLLAGKIFGISAVALLQLGLNALASAIAAVIAGVLYTVSPQGRQAAAAAASNPQAQEMMHRVMSEGLPHVPWTTLGYLIVFFFLGFFSYAAVYAGIGSLLSKPEEVQQYSTVFMLPIIAAYLLAIFALQNPDVSLVTWGSMIPLVSPLLMFTRITTTDVPAWQIAVSIGGSLAAIWGLTILAGKLYRVGVLMYGKPPRPSEIWRALRAHT